jgi:hypothetical protein
VEHEPMGVLWLPEDFSSEIQGLTCGLSLSRRDLDLALYCSSEYFRLLLEQSHAASDARRSPG